MALPITALFAGLLTLWLLFLAMVVIGFRRGKKVSLGAGGDELGERLIRGHGNAAETIPLFLVLLGLAEGLKSPDGFLYAVAMAFAIGRVLHGVHFMKIRQGFRLRFYGMLLTLLTTGILALDLIRHGFGL